MADLSYQNQLSTLGNMSEQDLNSFKDKVLSAFEDADSTDDLVAMSAAADALEQIHEVEQSRQGEVTNDAENTSDPNDAAEATVQPVAASAADPEDDDNGGDEPEDDDEAITSAAEPEDDDTPAEDLAADADAESAEGETGDEPQADAESPPEGGEGVTAAAEPEGEEPADAETEAAADAETPEAPAEPSDPPVTASADEGETEITVPVEAKDIPAERQPLVAAVSAPVVSAGADIPGIPAGHVYANEREMSEAFVSRLNAFRGGRGSDGDKVIVASVQQEVTDESRYLNDRDSSEVNADKINAVVRGMKTMGPGSEAIVASGGYCAPLEVRYSIFGVGVTDRPIRDSLAGFQATRGGIRYVTPPVLSSFSGAVGLWTAANDANPSAPATKPFLTAVCASPIDVTLDAITLEFQFGNLMTRAYPELVARNNELGLIYQARFAEQTLLTKIAALSTAVTATWQLGTSRDFLNSVGRLGAAYRTRHRLNAEDALRVLAPAWVRDAMREDLTRGSVAGGEPGMAIEWADGIINKALAARNINITWHLDDSAFTGAQAAGPIKDFPANIVYYLFAEGTFLFLDGGTLDLGIVRDSTLVGTNDYRMFVETFEGLAKVGVESIQATVTTHITGANVGTVTPS